MKRLGVALVLLLAGCLDPDAAPAAQCTAHLTASDVPDDALQEGGRGPRLLTIELPVAHAALIAWWAGQENGTVEFVALRTLDASDGTLKVHAPADRDVGLLAKDVPAANAGNQWAYALDLPAAPDPVTIDLTDQLRGTIAGTWSMPVSFGAGPQGPAWQPAPIDVLAANAARIEALSLGLSWDNGPGGGADFGIAVATGDQAFHYENRAYQASPGPQQETLTLTGEQLAGYGWGNGTPAKVGPSVSTGAFATTGLAYTLEWSATLKPGDGSQGDVCGVLGPVREVDVSHA